MTLHGGQLECVSTFLSDLWFSFYVWLLPSTSEFPLCVCSLLSSMVLHTGYPFQTTCRKVTPDTSGRKSIRELKSMHFSYVLCKFVQVMNTSY